MEIGRKEGKMILWSGREGGNWILWRVWRKVIGF